MSVLLLLGALGLRSILQVEHLDPDTDAQLRRRRPTLKETCYATFHRATSSRSRHTSSNRD